MRKFRNFWKFQDSGAFREGKFPDFPRVSGSWSERMGKLFPKIPELPEVAEIHDLLEIPEVSDISYDFKLSLIHI